MKTATQIKGRGLKSKVDKPAPVGKESTDGYCTPCARRRYGLDGQCLVCGGRLT